MLASEVTTLRETSEVQLLQEASLTPGRGRGGRQGRRAGLQTLQGDMDRNTDGNTAPHRRPAPVVTGHTPEKRSCKVTARPA